MPEYRQIHVSIWKDPWFFELEAAEKFLFIYLFSNERSNLTGLYELHTKVIAFETDLNTRQIDDAFATFERAGKVYRDGTWIWIPNLIKYNSGSLTSPTVRTHIKSSLDKIPDIALKARCIDYYNSMVDDEYRIDTLSIPYKQVTQEQEHEHDQENEQENKGAKNAPSNFDSWLEALRTPSTLGEKNGIGVLVQMGQALYERFPKSDKSTYGRVAGMAKKAGTQSKLAKVFWENSSKPLTDPLDYLTAVLNGNGTGKPQPPARAIKPVSAKDL